MIQPNKSKAKSYDDNFLDYVAESDLFKQWSNPKNNKLANTNAFDTEVHQIDLDTSNQNNLSEGINPFLNQYVDLTSEDPFNEIRAYNQSNLSKVLSGTGRVLTKATSEVLKLPGVIAGSIMAPFAEEGEGFETAFNNEWIKSIENLNQNINDSLLPVYVKKAVSEGNLWDNISSVDFWATEGADGMGFIVSMLAPGAALKSVGLGNKILGTTAKGLSLINGEGKLAAATQALTELGITAERIDLTATTLANTLFESGSEAGSAMQSFQEDLDNQLNNGLINQEQYNTLLQQKGKLGRDIFLSNVAILLGPNAIQSKMIWGKAGAKALTNEVAPGLLKKASNRLGNIASATASEGFFEEGLQSTVEEVFTNSAKKGELTDNILYDTNIGEMAEGYLDTISSTNGQKAIFLGGVLGGTISAYSGAKQDIVNRNNTNRILNLADTLVNNFNTVRETDPYNRDNNGNIILDNQGNPSYDAVKVNKIATNLRLTEQQSNEFDEAVKSGNQDLVQQYKNSAIDQLIIPFINEGESGIQALEQYLNSVTQDPNIQTNNKNNEVNELNKSIVNKAKYLQDQYQAYKDFSESLINLNNPNATAEDTSSFYNQLADTYLNYKAQEFTQKDNLSKLEKSKSKLLAELNGNENIITDEVIDPNATEDIFKYRHITDPRIKLLNNKIEETNNRLKNINKLVNQDIWNETEVNKAFNEIIKSNNKLREGSTPEKVAEVEEQINQVNEATTPVELDEIKSTNPVVKQQVEDKKEQFVQEELEVENTQRQEAINNELGITPEVQNDIESIENIDDLNITTPIENLTVSESYNDLSSTEASEYSDDIIPIQGVNNTTEDLKSVETGNVDNGKGVKVISTDRMTGLPLSFITQFFPKYLQYEREPVNKAGREVSFEINQNPGGNPNVNAALEAFNRGDYSNSKLLYDFLPINVRFTDEVNAPIETRRANNQIDIPTELLRIEIISKLIEGYSINDIKGSIQDQYKGILQIEPGVPENSILQLDAVNNNINYVRENLYVVNSQGLLQNILTNETQAFNNPFNKELDRSKENAKGEIYLMIPQANGKPFPLKLNIKKISQENAIILFELYKEILTNNKSFNTTLNEIDEYTKEAVLQYLDPELSIIGGTKEDIKIGDIVDLMIYTNSTNIKSQIRVDNGILYFGDQVATRDNIIDQRINIMNFLTNIKRHQIKIGPKSETDNTKTNLKSNSADYIKYLLNNKILNTNAVVNQPTFQGYTNIYLNPSVSLDNNAVKSQTIEEQAEEYWRNNVDENGYPKEALSEVVKRFENNRNNENNSLPLSKIEGTMENDIVEQVQDEVYEVPNDPRERNEDIKRLVALNKKIQSGKELRPNELKDFNKYKNAYPSEYEKRCK